MSGDNVAPGTSGGGSLENTADALTLLAQGKRHLLVKDYHEAIGSLGQACGLLAAKFGETADECGEAYLNYGKALLELARSESGVLGDAIEGGDGDGEKSNVDSDSDENEEENAGNDESEESEMAQDTDKNKEENEDGGETTNAENPDNPEDGDEDISNLKLSWEVLELAKIIFQRQANDTQMNLKLAEVYLNLGEVGLESETYEQAIQDLQSCLKILKEHLEPDNRRIAETYYNLGVAYSLNNELNESIKNYMNSLDILECRIKNLEGKVALGDKPHESDAFYTLEGEIKELNEIIPEVREKIAELKETKAETLKAVSDMLKEGTAGSSKNNGEVAKPAMTRPVSDISHLIRKKQKTDQVATSESKSEDLSSPKSEEMVPSKIQKSE